MMQNLTDAQKEYFKDTSLKNNNDELIVCYHITNTDFDAFDKKFIHTDDGYCGRGFYFTSMKYFSGACGTIKLECYLDIKNPLVVEDLDLYDKMDLLDYFAQCEDYKNGLLPRVEGHPTNYETIQAEYFIDILENFDIYDIKNTELIDLITDLKTSYDYTAFKETKDIFNILENPYTMNDLLQYEEFVEILKNNNLYEYVNDFKCLYLSDLTGNKFHRGYWNEFNGFLTEWAIEHGYDGIFSENSNDFEIREIVVFEPNQIKSIDNLYPTKDNNFKDNSQEYFQQKNHSNLLKKEQTLDEKLADADERVNRNIKETDIKDRER